MSNFAEFALSAFRGVKRDDMVADFDIGDTLSNGFDNSSTFVTTDNGESPFRVLAGESVCIGMTDLVLSVRHRERPMDCRAAPAIRDTYPSPKDLNAHFMGLGRRDFDVLDGQFPSSFPSNRCLPRISFPSSGEKSARTDLAGNCLSSSVRHSSDV